MSGSSKPAQEERIGKAQESPREASETQSKAVTKPTSGHIIKAWLDPKFHFDAVLNDPWYQLIFQLKAHFYFETVAFYKSEGFLPALVPITCNSISSPISLGSDSLPVKIDLFNKETYLADSMQFHLEYMLRQAHKGVFYIMGTFRGEEPDARHLNQFFHSEAEMKGGLDVVMDLVTKYLLHCAGNIYKNCSGAIEKVVGSLDHLERFLQVGTAIPKVTYGEAIGILGPTGSFYEHPIEGWAKISSRGEQALMRYFSGPVWLTHLPAISVPFYQALDPGKKYALCADLLMGIGEVVGAGERHSNAEETMAALQAHKIDPSGYDWYLRMKRDYPMRTAGFGLGIERFLLWLLNHDDIRDVSLISRIKGFESIL
jgi:asparaginyl-tRNA synthetase